MPRRRSEPGPESNRRAELLRAAARLFVDKGFDATTTRDIADAVGMRAGSPFYHFRSKQELLKAAMIEGLDAGYARLVAAIAGIADPGQRLRVLVRTHLGTLLEGDCHSPMLLGETRRSMPPRGRRLPPPSIATRSPGRRHSTNWRGPVASPRRCRR